MTGQELIPRLTEGVYLVDGRFVYWSGRAIWAHWSLSIDRGVRFYYSLADTAYKLPPVLLTMTLTASVPLSELVS